MLASNSKRAPETVADIPGKQGDLLRKANASRPTHHLARSHRQLDLPRNRFQKLTLHRLTNYIFNIVTIHRGNIVTFVVLFNDNFGV